MAQNINESREANGQRAIHLDPDLSIAARAHSRDMAAKGEPYHSTTRTISRMIKGTWKDMAENVGAGGTATGMHREFLNSPVHRENIFGRGWDHIGVGVVMKDGRHWVTVLFEKGPNLETATNKTPC